MIETLPYPMLESRILQAVPVLTDDVLFSACGVRVMFTGREGGVSGQSYASLNMAFHVGDDPDCVMRNRQLACEVAGVPNSPIIAPNQVHGTSIVRVSDAQDVDYATAQAAEGADAVVVEVADVPTLIAAADCLTFAVVSPTGRVAVGHAGWRGAVAGIAGKVVRAMAQVDSRAPVDYNVYLGPHIRSECFEVGEDVAAQFAEAYGEGALADECHVSLAQAVTIDLVRAGVDARRIADAGICTKCHPERYYSYRATSGDCGRHALIAVRVGKD